MHKPDDTDVDTAIKTTNLALKSIVGHEKQGYNATLKDIKNTSARLNAAVSQNKTLNNIIRNLTAAVNLMIRLEWNCCRIYNDAQGAANIMSQFGVYLEGINAS